MLLTLNNDLSEVRLNVPPLTKSGKGYDRDLMDAIGKYFEASPREALAFEAPLSSIAGRFVLPTAHALSARSGFDLNVTCFDINFPDGELPSQLRRQFSSASISEEIIQRQRELVKFGQQFGVQYFDSQVPSESIREFLSMDRVGLVGLDWKLILASPQSPVEESPFEPAHRRLIEEAKPIFDPVMLVVGYNARSFLINTYENSR